MRLRAALSVSIFLTFAGCETLALEELIRAIEIEPPAETIEADTPRGRETLEVPPPPPDVGEPGQTEVPDAVIQQSGERVTPAMLEMASPIVGRLSRALASSQTVDEKVATARAYTFTEEEKESASVLGFRSISIDISVGGNTPYILGGSLSQGIAFSLNGQSPRWMTGGGISMGVPGVGGDLQIGFWTNDVDDLNGWSYAVNLNVVGPKYVGATVGAFWSAGLSPRFEGFSLGPAVSKPGGGADAGLAWSMHTSKIGEIGQDVGNVFSADGTRYGADIGESCNVGADCKGYKSPVGRPDTGTACCGGTCQQTRKDYLGVSWCPAVCKKTLFSAPGTC